MISKLPVLSTACGTAKTMMSVIPTCLIGCMLMKSGFLCTAMGSATCLTKTRNHLIIQPTTKAIFTRWQKNREQWWDGKIGIWPLGEMNYAQKTSKNQSKGTLIWVDQSVNKNILWAHDWKYCTSNTWRVSVFLSGQVEQERCSFSIKWSEAHIVPNDLD